MKFWNNVKTGDLVRIKGSTHNGRYISGWVNHEGHYCRVKLFGVVRMIPKKDLRKPYGKKMLNFVIWINSYIFGAK